MDLMQSILSEMPIQGQIAIFIIVGIIVLAFLFIVLKYGSLWIQAWVVLLEE